MAEIILNDPIAVRRCILLEFLSGKPIWICFLNFCHKLGENAIEYQEFEFWFMRFARKEYELDYDRSKDPPSRNFANLPLEILHEVMGNLNGKQRQSCTSVCKKLRNAGSTLKLPYTIFRVGIGYDSTRLSFYEGNLHSFNEYRRTEDCCDMGVRSWPQKYYENKLDYFKMALNDVEAFLNQPKLELEKLEIVRVDRKYRDDFGAMFQKLPQKVKTKELHVITEEMDELQILPYLDPSFIEEVHLKVNEESQNRMDKLLELEQCRNVKMIKFKLDFGRIEEFRVENFMNFKRFALIFLLFGMDAEKFMGTVKTLLTSTSLELVHLDFARTDLIDSVRTELDKITVKIPGNLIIRKISVPNSSEYFEIEFIGNTVVRIERKKSSARNYNIHKLS